MVGLDSFRCPVVPSLTDLTLTVNRLY